jgi:hypothetical protein
MFYDPDDMGTYLERQSVLNNRSCPIQPRAKGRLFKNNLISKSPMVMMAKNLFTMGLDQTSREKIAARTNFFSRAGKADAFQAISNLFEKIGDKSWRPSVRDYLTNHDLVSEIQNSLPQD